MLIKKSHTPPRALHLHFNVFWELGDKATFLIGKHQVTQWALERCCGGEEGEGREEGGERREGEREEGREGERGGEGREEGGRRREKRERGGEGGGRSGERREEGGTPAPLQFPGWAAASRQRWLSRREKLSGDKADFFGD